MIVTQLYYFYDPTTPGAWPSQRTRWQVCTPRPLLSETLGVGPGHETELNWLLVSQCSSFCSLFLETNAWETFPGFELEFNASLNKCWTTWATTTTQKQLSEELSRSKIVHNFHPNTFKNDICSSGCRVSKMALCLLHLGLLWDGHHLRLEDQPLHRHRSHGQPGNRTNARAQIST